MFPLAPPRPEAGRETSRIGPYESSLRTSTSGGDIFLPISVPPDQFEEAAAEVVQQILTTNYPERAIALADQIRSEWPHLVGLQEVYQIKICLVDQPTVCPVDQDYLEILLDNLNPYWKSYKVASSVTNTQLVNLPAKLPDETPVFVTIIDRDVTLAHHFVRTENAFGKNYDTFLPVPNPLDPGSFINVLRGYTTVNARVWGNEYFFVNTHLEVTGAGLPEEPFFRSIQTGQVLELLGLLAQNTDTQIVVGDFNSDPFDGPFVPCKLPDGLGGFIDGFCPTPYISMSGVNPFGIWLTDVWYLQEFEGFYEPGNTCCQATLLDNPVSQLYERIDQVWARPAPEIEGQTRFLRYVRVDVIGEEEADKTPSGLWPSDHAGVSARMLVRAPR